MSDFEKIIRPFETRDTTPRPYASGQAGVANVLLQIGRNGQGKTVNGSFSSHTTIYMTRYDNEKKRQ